MANIIIGRIVSKIDCGTFQYNDGSLGRKVEVWLMPCYFDRYSGVMSFPMNQDEMLNITCRDRQADIINQFDINSDVSITYELRGRRIKVQATGEEKVFNSIEAKYIDPFPRQR